MNDTQSKKEQRLKAMAGRKAMGPQQRERCSLAICRRLISLPAVQSADVILSYAATAEEADLSLFHKWAREKGKTLAFPRTMPHGVMEACAAGEADGWRTGMFGIPEPDGKGSLRLSPGEIRLVLVPCVAFDPEGRRLGHGGGYYDRYLPGCENARFAAIAFEAQKIPRVAAEEHDVGMDMIVTECGTYYFGRTKETGGFP